MVLIDDNKNFTDTNDFIEDNSKLQVLLLKKILKELKEINAKTI